MPGEVFYQDSVERSLNSKLGEGFSVLDIKPTAGKGAVNEALVFADAYDSKLNKGGGSVKVPGVVGGGYRFDLPLELAGLFPIEFVGEGRSSKVFRGSNMPDGKGMINITGATTVTFRHMYFDGSVTVPVGVNYSDFAGDPAHNILTKNSMIWIHGGADITFEDCDFEHTGGYLCYLDARAQNVSRVRFIRCRFRNNRPHLFGTSGGDLNYGSWTGGIFYQNQATGGSQTRVTDLTVRQCQFARNTGNCVWGHAYGFDSLHQRVHVDHNTFLDCGLDAVEFGNVVGGSCNGNSFRRIGYICTDDTSPSVPKWLANLNATGLDTSGVVKLVTYSNNDFLSVNGGAINGDGYCYGTIVGNTIRQPRVGDLEYTEDSIALCGPPGGIGQNWMQGIVMGNTANQDGGIAISISGNMMDNLGGTAIGLFACRKSYCGGNLIIAPDAPNSPPITMGGLFSGANQVCTDNLVTENVIHYNSATAAPAIHEDASYRAFTSADKNNVVKNRVVGVNAYEFRRDPNSGSGTALSLTTANFVTSQHCHVMQREGSSAGFDSVLRWYAQDGLVGYPHMSLQVYRGGGIRDPILNVSEGGLGGVISTGPYTSAAFTNAMLTSKLCGTGFLALTDVTYTDADANLLDASWALLKWDNALHRWRQSVTVSGSVRVWSDFSSGGVAGAAGGPFTSVQFNDAGILNGTGNFTFDKVGQLVNIIALNGAAAGLNVANGFVQSVTGFVALGTGLNYNAIQAPGGGLAAKSCSLTVYQLFARTATIAPLPADDFTLKVMLWQDSASGFLRLSEGTGVTTSSFADGTMRLKGLFASGVSFNAVQAPNGGFLGRNISLTDYALFARIGSISPMVSDDFINKVMLWDDAASGFLHLSQGSGLGVLSDGVLQLGGLYCTGNLFNSIQVPTGGVFVGTQVSSPLYYSLRNDADSHLIMDRTVATVAQWGLAMTTSGDFAVTNRSSGFHAFLIFKSSAGATTTVFTPGVFQSPVGFLTTNANYQAVNAGSGGSYANSHRSVSYTQIGQGSGVPSLTPFDAFVDGCMFYDVGTNKLMVMISGGFVAVNTSSGSTTTAPQWTATNTGTATTFNNSNFNFQVNGNGDISFVGVLNSTGGGGGLNVTGQFAQNSIQSVGGFNAGSTGSGNGVYQVHGTTVINSSRQFVGTDIHLTGNCEAVGYGVVGGFIGQTWTITFPSAFNIAGFGSFTSLIFKAGLLVSAA